jgi:uncharacterized protein
MKIADWMVDIALSRPKWVVGVMVLATVIIGLLAGLPSLFPDTFPMLFPLRVDTDPENMLSRDEPVRVFHNRMKKVLDLNDIVVVGVVNESHEQGVFNAASLGRVYELTQYAKTLQWPSDDDPEKMEGVVVNDIIAPSMVDNIEQGGPGEVRFEWLMPKPPANDEEARAVRKKAEALPFLKGTMISENGKALALYLPITSKDQSYKVASALKEKIAGFKGEDEFHITGLPVANDTFGVQMFIQMGISAPLAMLVIFLLLLFFFRKLVLIISPMILALVSVILTMGLLVITGNTVHIMSSMIPIFIMPIAVLDSIHILSEFFDRYQETKDRRKTITHVVESLFTPMLYTSLTSAAGFVSLALTPIPPVQVFGIFVAIGILLAWLLTMLFIPAYVMFIPQRRLANFGAVHGEEEEDGDPGAKTLLGRFLAGAGAFTWSYGKVVLGIAALCIAVAIYGISLIRINDNPTRWFRESHPIRVADQVLNRHFGGTYMAYIALQPATEDRDSAAYAEAMKKRLDTFIEENSAMTPGLESAAKTFRDEIGSAAAKADSVTDLRSRLSGFADEQAAQAEGGASWAWEDLRSFISAETQRDDVFKQPEALRWIEELEEDLLTTGVVGKSNSLTALVKTVHRELIGEEEAFRVPDSARAVAQCIITYESSHRPRDLYHFVTPDYRTASIWVQLKSGDNQDMSRVIAAVDAFVAENPPPLNIKHEWFGLTYINVIWQDKMVSGMLQAFMGSFLVVLLMMTILFRSALWGLLCMIPLTLTIGLIYGVIGLAGKDYDMPVAVLSSLTLGLAVDFAIHYLARARAIYMDSRDLGKTHRRVFGEPARAIVRNIIVIAVGFLPLIFAPLLPYVTVGVLLAAILFVSGAATLLLLPVLMKLMEKLLFPATMLCNVTCKCGTCIVSGMVFIALAAVNIYQFLTMGWDTMTWFTLGALPVVAAVCWLFSRRASCMPRQEKAEETTD